MSPGDIYTFVFGWVTGVLTPIFVEFLKRRLFDRPKLQIRTDLVPGDPESVEVPPFLHVSTVNTTDVPIILTAAFYTISYGEQAVGVMEHNLPELVEKHEFPLKLTRHEEYQQGVQLVPWIQDFLKSRVSFYNDKSSLDYSKLMFDVGFLDTTGHHWESKKVKLHDEEVEAIRKTFARVAPSDD